jgi:hypothetical protein
MLTKIKTTALVFTTAIALSASANANTINLNERLGSMLTNALDSAVAEMNSSLQDTIDQAKSGLTFELDKKAYQNDYVFNAEHMIATLEQSELSERAE